MAILRINPNNDVNNIDVINERGRVVAKGHLEIDMEPQRPGDIQSTRFVCTTTTHNQGQDRAQFLTHDDKGNPEIVEVSN